MTVSAHTTSKAGLTLIELLISISLGMILLAMGSSALLQVSKIAKRDTAQRQAHEDVASLSRKLQLGLGAMHHGSLVRLEADPGSGGWGSGDETITIYWLCTLRDRAERSQGFDVEYDRSLVWNMIQWVGDDSTDFVGDGEIRYAVSPRGYTTQRTRPYDTSGIRADRWYSNETQWRRDRRRDLDDNDGRWIEGMTPGALDDIGLPGDRESLARVALRAHPPSTKVTEFAIEWIDAGGAVVRCDAENGISINGTPLPANPSKPWHSQTGYSVDGVYVDGRVVIPVDSTRNNVAQRPNLVRFGFTLIPTTNTGLELEEEPNLPFQLTYATTSKLPYLP